MADTNADELFELKSALLLLTAEIRDATAGTTDYSKATAATIAAEEQNREETKKSTKAQQELNAAKKNATENLKKFGNELLKIGEAGIKFASAIGTSATRGVELEFKNRTALISQLGQLFKGEQDRIVSSVQQQAAQQSLTDTFISTRDGFQLSAKGVQAFAQNLKGGFKSEFQLTNESLRALVTTGMATEAQFESFRKASGRASLSSGQFATIVNKNSLSFLLYGNKFARAAADAEKLGISLASVQSAQEGLVTNLDGTIDTVAQLNQLGAQIDFGTLIRVAEQEGPDALLAYARATIPANMLQSASTRALFKQLGISAEDFLKAGGKQESAAQSIEKQMTEAAKKTNGFGATLLTVATVAKDILMSSFGAVALSGYAAAKYLWSVAMAARANAAVTPAGGGGVGGGVGGGAGGAGAGSAMKRMAGGAKMGAGVGAATGLVSGIMEYQQSGSVKQAIIRGLANLAGSVVGGALGSFIPIPGVGTFLGASAGAWLANYLVDKVFKADDMMSTSQYGSRALVTPSGTYALNNADDIIAGTNLFPKGSLGVGKPGASDANSKELVNKINELIGVLKTATTIINIDNKIQEVPRYAMAGVYTRNERR